MANKNWNFDYFNQCEYSEKFINNGYVIFPVCDTEALTCIRDEIINVICNKLGLKLEKTPEDILNSIHEYIEIEDLNEFRLEIFQQLNAKPWFRAAYYSMGQSVLTKIVGNELAMQRRINLSIQLPKDTSSLLPLHADVWSGDSPFEVVMWVPLVDCYKTKAMYLLPPAASAKFNDTMSTYATKGVEAATRSLGEELEFIEIPFGSVMIFNQSLPHGNKVNEEIETRWSLNCRFKSVFSPYADKKLGEFFSPITLKPASRLGLAYELPRGFKSQKND